MIKEKKIDGLEWSKDLIKLPTYALRVPKNDLEYEKLEKLLDQLIDEVRDDENHPLADVMEIIGENLEAYDDQHKKPLENDITPVELIRYIMVENNLKQKDLVDIFGSQGNVSSFLSGRRKLTLKQIQALKDQFYLSADALVN
ncbi:hypothetical protein L3V86_06215 [Thiotrichales bacterium 19S11-10]|nr:hypothetical protein [Thiotrichales bacterium 19S11-10]MCF6807654.1 hypothetical protein [Thiotrichales bacterium 19S9-11]MCF6811623.1 hypothetical protein [Thiotrichales bacterium 19S9-12]